MNKVKFGMGKKITMMFLFVILVPMLVLGSMSYFSARDSLIESSDDSSTKFVDVTKESINFYLDEFGKLVEDVAIDSRIEGIENGSSNLKDGLDRLRDSHSTYKGLLNLYVGTEAGNMHIIPEQVLPDWFVAKERPWYKEAVSNGTLSWTEPYQDAGSGTMVISNGMVVKDGGKLVGVAASDIALSDLTDKVKNFKLGETGEIIIVSKSGLLISHVNKDVVGLQMRDKGIINNINSESGKFEYIENKDLEEAPVFDKETSAARKKLGLSENPPVLSEGESKYAYFTTTELGWKVIVTVDKSEVLAPAKGVLIRITLIGIISMIAAIILAIVFSKNVTKAVSTILNGTEKIKNGDLTTSFDIKTKDEMNLLSTYLNEAFLHLSDMIKDIKTMSGEVSDAATNLAATSEEASASADEVSRTVIEIADGAQSQADDTGKSAEIAYSLSEKLTSLSGNTQGMIDSAKTVMEVNVEGTKKIEDLSKSSKASSEANERIGKSIADLNTKTRDIDSILVSITSIAEQTNLLALNASIEAARAGEHGRGFAVVADEIRKLAEESNQSAEQIRGIIGNIQKDSEKTVQEMKDVEDISKEQTAAVDDMNKSFEVISDAITEIANKIDLISSSVGELNEDKDNLLSSIENISAVSEETAAGAIEVSSATEQQKVAVTEVAELAGLLNEIAYKLNGELDKFRV